MNVEWQDYEMSDQCQQRYQQQYQQRYLLPLPKPIPKRVNIKNSIRLTHHGPGTALKQDVCCSLQGMSKFMASVCKLSDIPAAWS